METVNLVFIFWGLCTDDLAAWWIQEHLFLSRLSGPYKSWCTLLKFSGRTLKIHLEGRGQVPPASIHPHSLYSSSSDSWWRGPSFWGSMGKCEVLEAVKNEFSYGNYLPPGKCSVSSNNHHSFLSPGSLSAGLSSWHCQVPWIFLELRGRRGRGSWGCSKS